MIITKIVKSKKFQSLIYLDGEFYCALDNYFIALYNLKIGQEIDLEDLEKIAFESDFKRAKEKAFYILERRDHSSFELISKLKKDFSEDVAIKVADKMVDLGLINDEKFARKYAEELLFSKHYSKYRAKLELLKKGIDKDFVSNLLGDFEVDENENIRELLQKKYKNAFTDEKVKRRAIAFLQRQGYKFENIRHVFLDANENF